jgi:hypothetical protein
VARLGNEERVRRCIEILDNYKGAKGKKYRSDYRAILCWVIDKLEEEEAKKSRRDLNERASPNRSITEIPEWERRFYGEEGNDTS